MVEYLWKKDQMPNECFIFKQGNLIGRPNNILEGFISVFECCVNHCARWKAFLDAVIASCHSKYKTSNLGRECDCDWFVERLSPKTGALQNAADWRLFSIGGFFNQQIRWNCHYHWQKQQTNKQTNKNSDKRKKN